MKLKWIYGLAALLLIGMFMAACQVGDKETSPSFSSQNEGEQGEEEPEIIDDPPEEEPEITYDPLAEEAPDPIEEPEEELEIPDEPPAHQVDELGLGYYEVWGLDRDTERRIIELWAEQRYNYQERKTFYDNQMQRLNLTFYEYFEVVAYYGTYKGYAVIQDSTGTLAIGVKIHFGDIKFEYGSGGTVNNHLRVWKDGEFYDIEVLYEEGTLTRENIIQIGENRFQTKPYNERPVSPYFLFYIGGKLIEPIR